MPSMASVKFLKDPRYNNAEKTLKIASSLNSSVLVSL